MQPPYQPTPPPTNQSLQVATDLADRSAERALSVLAHAAIAFGFFGFTWIITLLISGVVWLYSRRSPEVRFHAEQAGCYQCSVLLINVLFIVVLGVGGGFSIVGAFQGNGWEPARWVAWGFVIFAIWFIASILYGIYAAIMVLMGKRFKYPIIGDRFEKKVW